ncbi:putative ABC transporter, ATP-binding protein [Vibrio ichthyoenteri ATCC 700023]|uniref:Putative ABC transporter, ATP-binding protein n=1 Tax=Vibrio ichthyoenteri ATCC 700023 TaxID=870968 RepID=F9S3L5_9VIBR|nr:ATP-binding cassette domain-containing protein [Vibrio ichthyoenteri]EGU37840.1 putative ABC transporter, ATP-binding protein [Vibrio ichthyoenteri ATCC 700023]
MTLSLKNLIIYKQDGQALCSSIDLTIAKGEVTALMGPSGCGKSTLFNLISGHLSDEFHYQGEVMLDNDDIAKRPAHQRGVGILFQDDLLFPHLTIWQNLAFALPNSVPKPARKAQALSCLESVDLQSLADSYPDQISGGQRARISLLRMILAKPQVALLDEPFSKLDKTLRHQFRDWVVAQLAEANIPTLLVTHDINDVPSQATVIQWPQASSDCNSTKI